MLILLLSFIFVFVPITCLPLLDHCLGILAMSSEDEDHVYFTLAFPQPKSDIWGQL